MSNKVYIGNFPNTFTRDDILNLFRDFDGIELEKFSIEDKKCYAFILCVDQSQAIDVIKTMNSVNVCGRTLIVRPASKRGEPQKRIEVSKDNQLRQPTTNTKKNLPKTMRFASDFVDETVRDFPTGVRFKNSLSQKLHNESMKGNNSDYKSNVPLLSTPNLLNPNKLPTVSRPSNVCQSSVHSINENNSKAPERKFSSPYARMKDKLQHTSQSLNEFDAAVNSLSAAEEDYSPQTRNISRSETTASNYISESSPLNANSHLKNSTHNKGTHIFSKENKQVDGQNNNFGRKSPDSDNHSSSSGWTNQTIATDASFEETRKFLSPYARMKDKLKHASQSLNEPHTAVNSLSVAEPKGEHTQGNHSPYRKTDFINRGSDESHVTRNTSRSETTASNNVSKSSPLNANSQVHNRTPNKGKHLVPKKTDQQNNDYGSRSPESDIQSSSSGWTDCQTLATDASFEETNQFYYASVSNFPIGTSLGDLYELFEDQNPFKIVMICNVALKSRKATEAIACFETDDQLTDAIMNHDNTVYFGRALVVTDATDEKILPELLFLNSKRK